MAGLLEVNADEAVGGSLNDIDDDAFVLAHAAALDRGGPRRRRRWRRRRFCRQG